MYGNSINCAGAGKSFDVGARQPEVTGAVSTAHAEMDALELELANFLVRLEQVSSHKPQSCDNSATPVPGYSSELGGRIGALIDRIAVARRRIQQAASDLEV